MFAINHAATSLLIRRRYPDVGFVPILLSVQAMELLWVALNYAGLERTTTEPVVRYVGDIHLAYMPFSHSVATMLAVAGLSWAAAVVFQRPRLGAAFGLGVLSHLLLDLATHNGDIALAPFIEDRSYGTYLYGNWPAVAFAVELGFGMFCWWVYRGSRALLAVIIGFNLANLSLFFAAVPGMEGLLAGRPQVLVTVILVQIVVTLWAIWWAAHRRANGEAVG
ncbi:MAG: metal-dependent hydrolase [Vicinamibacterales bacterium]